MPSLSVCYNMVSTRGSTTLHLELVCLSNEYSTVSWLDMGHWSQATGIDIPMLDNVINYHFPSQPKLFVHRVGKSPLRCMPRHMTIVPVTWPISAIGRVARADRSGRDYSLVSHDEVAYMIDLHLYLGRPVTYKGSDGEKLTYRIIEHKHVTVHYKVILKQIHCLLLLLYICAPVVVYGVLYQCPSIVSLTDMSVSQEITPIINSILIEWQIPYNMYHHKIYIGDTTAVLTVVKALWC